MIYIIQYIIYIILHHTTLYIILDNVGITNTITTEKILSYSLRYYVPHKLLVTPSIKC